MVSEYINHINNNYHCTVFEQMSCPSLLVPISQTVNEAGVANFTATASGIRIREFEYEWFKFKRTKSTMIVGRNRNLIINNVRVKDAGSYYSCVKNEWDNRKCSLTVTVIINGKLQNYIICTVFIRIEARASIFYK